MPEVTQHVCACVRVCHSQSFSTIPESTHICRHRWPNIPLWPDANCRSTDKNWSADANLHRQNYPSWDKTGFRSIKSAKCLSEQWKTDTISGDSDFTSCTVKLPSCLSCPVWTLSLASRWESAVFALTSHCTFAPPSWQDADMRHINHRAASPSTTHRTAAKSKSQRRYLDNLTTPTSNWIRWLFSSFPDSSQILKRVLF